MLEWAMRWPIILVSPCDLAAEADQALYAKMFSVKAELAKPGSLQGFDILYTDRLQELLSCVTKLGWGFALASPSLARDEQEFSSSTLMEVLGPAAARTMFCSQGDSEFVVEACWRCNALCQGLIDEEGCESCRDEDGSDTGICDCEEGGGFENPLRCPIHNMSHNHAQRQAWGSASGTGSTRRPVPPSQKNHIADLMGYK